MTAIDRMPPGYSEYETTARYTCNNEECWNYGHEWDVSGVQEHGDFTPNNDEDTCCQDCGEEGE